MEDEEILETVDHGLATVGLASISGILCVYVVQEGKSKIIPITKEVAHAFGFDKVPSAEKLFKERDTRVKNLIKSGRMGDEAWLRSQMRFVDTAGRDLGDWPAHIIKNIQEQLQYPTARRRLARLFTHAMMEKEILSYEIAELPHALASSPFPAQMVDRAYKDSKDYFDSTKPHALYDIIRESYARIEQYCNGVLEGRNLDGRSEFKSLPTILKEIDQNLSWDDFLKLQKTNPKKFNAYMTRIKEISFITMIQNLPKGTYTKAALDYATQADKMGNKGALKNLKLIVRDYAKEQGMDFNTVWSVIEKYATGKEEIPGLEGCFDKTGNLTDYARKKSAKLEYQQAQNSLLNAREEETIQRWQKSMTDARSKLMELPEFKYIAEQKGMPWLEEHFDAILNLGSLDKLLDRWTITEGVDGLTEYRDKTGFCYNVDNQGRLVSYVMPSKIKNRVYTCQYDAAGKIVSVIKDGQVFQGDDLLDAIDLAKEAEMLHLAKNNKEITISAGKHPTKSHAPEVSSAKRQIAGAALHLGGRVLLMHGAGYVGRKYREWQVHKGEVFREDVTDSGESLALKKAESLLGVGGSVLMGASAALILGGSKVVASKAGVVAAKTVPVVGTVLGCGYGIVRACKGDWTGAGMEFASAGLDVVSGLGVAASATGVGAIAGVPLSTWAMSASLALDTTLALRDGLKSIPDGPNHFALVDEQGNTVMGKDKNGKKTPVVGASITYENGAKNGDAIFYDRCSDGKVKPVACGKYLDDKKEGRWEVYDEQGHIREILNYKNGKLCGKYQSFDENGDLLASGTFPTGEYEEYWTDENGHSTGIVRKSGQFENGHQVGEWYILGEDGKEYTYDFTPHMKDPNGHQVMYDLPNTSSTRNQPKSTLSLPSQDFPELEQMQKDANVTVEVEDRRFKGKSPKNSREAAEQNGYFGHRPGGVDDLVAQRAEGGRGVQAKKGSQRRSMRCIQVVVNIKELN